MLMSCTSFLIKETLYKLAQRLLCCPTHYYLGQELLPFGLREELFFPGVKEQPGQLGCLGSRENPCFAPIPGRTCRDREDMNP